MKKLVVSLALAFAAWGAFAAQCEGLTKAGVRCKRDAAEGSRYCLGHADQAKPATAKKLKDDGTCWAVTEAGTRCRHPKDGESDYCKQHGPDVKVKNPLDQCRALKWDGQRCGRKPEAGYLYCAQHRKLGATAAKPAEKPAAKPKAAKKK